MIFPGDKIISVEDVCCKEKNLEELNLLLNSQKDIITLKVEKSNDFGKKRLYIDSEYNFLKFKIY